MTDQVSFNDGDPRVDNQCELPTILSLQALDGLSAPESRIQAVPETAEAGTPMNRDLRNCCDPYLNHARWAWFNFSIFAGDKSRVAGVELATASEPPARKPRIWGRHPRASTPATPRCNLLLNHAQLVNQPQTEAEVSGDGAVLRQSRSALRRSQMGHRHGRAIGAEWTIRPRGRPKRQS